MKRLIASLFILFLIAEAEAQNYELPVGSITLDSFTVTAVRGGLDIADLIEIMQFDSTLYIAYNNLHFINCHFATDIEVLDKRSRTDATLKQEILQRYDGKCRIQEVASEDRQGSFLNRKGEEKFYTVDLFTSTFYHDRPICNEKRRNNWAEAVRGSKKEGHLSAVKRVIFNPGSPVDLPLIGKKFALFEADMMKYYDYTIRRQEVNGEDCYVFSVIVKPEYAGTRKDVIVRSLVTAFRRADFQVVGRDYHLYYNGGFVDIDIAMQVDLFDREGKFYPGHISYDGYFNVPTKKPERVKMKTDFLIP